MRLNSHITVQGEQQPRERILVEHPVSVSRILIGIVIVAVLLRVASALFQGNTVTDLPGIFDQLSYHELAQRVVEGHGFSFAAAHWPATRANEPTAHWSYLYTLYLAVVYSLFGVQPLIARLIQAVAAGILHPWLTWRLGRRVFGPNTGMVAAGLSAIYIYFFYYSGGLLTETFYIIGILWVFDVALRLTERRNRPGGSDDAGTLRQTRLYLWLELGLALGITVLLRQLFLLFIPFLFLWIWWNWSSMPSTEGTAQSAMPWIRWPALRGFGIVLLVVVLMIIPWTARNYLAFERFVLLNTNAGYAFFWGNHPIYGTHFVGLLPSDGPSYYDLIPPELLSLDEAALEQALLRRGIGFVIADPGRIVLLSLSRAVEYFKFWPSSSSSTLSNLSRVGSFGILLPFMLYGLWLSFRLMVRPMREQQRSQIFLLYLFGVVYTGIHLVSWALIRYRLPVDALLLIMAGLALTDISRRFFARRQRYPGTIAAW